MGELIYDGLWIKCEASEILKLRVYICNANRIPELMGGLFLRLC